ncbi:MAG: DUF3467 domain-containing protein [Desulfobacterales bacterium]
MSNKPQNDNKGIEVKPIPSSDILASRLYSNYIEITQSPYDLSLKFCDAIPIKNVEEVQKNKGVFKIPIVAEIVIPFAIVKSLIDALQVHYDQFKKRIGESDDKKTEKK